MKFSNSQRARHQCCVVYLLLLFLVQAAPIAVYAQNLGGQPALNKAVQGQTAAQPEGAFLNLVNWVGNVIAPVGAALCVVMAIVAYTHGRGVTRWAVAAGVPHEWYQHDSDGLQKLVEELHQRRLKIRDLISAFRDSSRNPFPNWK